MAKEKMTPREVAESRLSRLCGEVLTVIEAVVPPVEQDLTYTYSGGNLTMATSGPPSSRQNTQREAIKDLVRSAFNRAQDDIAKWID